MPSKNMYDSLTGLNVVQELKGLLEEEVNLTIHQQRPLGIIMLALDNLQKFNHRFGYDTGDELLRQFGSFLQSVIRQGDIAYRIGYDEFILFLREAPLEIVQRRAKQLQRMIRHLEAQKAIMASEQVTLSVGVASFPHNGVTGEALLRASLTFLARAKNAGGDRVVSG